MPAQVCHALAGRRAIKSALQQDGMQQDGMRQNGMRKSVEATREGVWSPAFNLGCQGPDIFAHNRRTRPFALAYARLLHRHHYGSFSKAFVSRLFGGGILESARGDDALDWLRGFVTHQAIDRALHPYIAYRSHIKRSLRFPLVNSARFHAFFERLLDSWIHLRLEGAPISRFDTGSSFALDAEDARFLSTLIAEAARDVYESATQDDLIEERVENAFKDASYFYAMTNPAATAMNVDFPTDGLREFIEMGAAGVALLHPQTRDGGVDWLNESRAAWRDPVDGRARTESAIDLFDSGVRDATRCLIALERVMSGSERPEELALAVGDEPLSVRDREGKVASVAFSDPFDLESALDAELTARREWLARRSSADSRPSSDRGPSVDRAKRELV